MRTEPIRPHRLIQLLLVSLVFVLVTPFVTSQQPDSAPRKRAPIQTTENGLKYRSSWIGSSWSGGPEWMQTSISYLTVLPDGRILTASGWDEAHRESTIYSPDGDIVAGVAKTQSRAI